MANAQYWSQVAAGSVNYRGEKTITTAAPDTTPAQVLPVNIQRIAVTIQNVGSVDVYLGTDDTVSSSNGLLLKAGSYISDDSSIDAWWAVAASGTADLRIVEVQ